MAAIRSTDRESQSSDEGDDRSPDKKSADTAKLQRLVEQRTAELAHLNESLQRACEEHKKVEKALLDSDERFRSIYERSPLVYQSLNKEGYLIEVNPAWLDLLGYEYEEAIGRWFGDFLTPDCSEHFRTRFPSFKTAGETHGAQFEMVRKDGSQIAIEIDGKTGYDKEGNFKQIHCIVRDVTQIRRAEEEQRQRASLNQIILDGLPPLAMLLRYKTREIVASNKAGKDVGAVPGRICYETWWQSTRPCPWCKAPVLWETGEVQQAQIDGADRIWDVYWVPVSDDLYLHYAYDITGRKRAEEEREKLVAQLKAKNSELDQFAYRVSHDLKSPLITIQGFVGMLKEDLEQEINEQAEIDLARISNAADRMRRLLDDILELSRIGRAVNPPKEVKLEELANEAVELVSGPLKEEGIRVEIAPGLPLLYGDHLRLREVLQNMIENSVKYMGDRSEPRIEIGARQDGRDTVCFVRDNGKGIDPQHHKRVFGLFDKLDESSEGTGIGLAVAKRIIEVHGGRIWVESDGAGKGATFCFTIPAKQGNAM